MSRLVMVVLVTLAVVGGFVEPLKDLSPKFVPPRRVADKVFLKKQMELLGLFYHIDEPLHQPELITISQTWSLKENMDNYKNITAVNIYMEIMQKKWILPREVPFTVLNPAQLFEAKTLYNIFYSSKNYDTFYKTAVYMRDRVNENLYIYVLSVAILNYPETQNIILPPLYEVFPSYYHNGQIMSMAQRINTHGKRMIENYPNTFLWEDNVVIRWNETVWPYQNKEFALSYFTNDYHFNTQYYNLHVSVPFWITGDEGPTAKLNRGEYFWYLHKEILTHYYLERLSNGLGEIPELDYKMVEQGYESGLLYPNGIPFPSRPNYFKLNQPMFENYISTIKDVESRIRNAIDLGYFIDRNGKQISIRTPESLVLLGKLIEGNVDSPNPEYYKDIVSLWKVLLGNSLKPSVSYVNGHTPLIVPSALEHYQTAMRDPAFYMIWKRVQNFFNMWSSYLPAYKFEDLSLPSVKIKHVEVDKLVTYFENVYMNVTNQLYMTEKEAKDMTDDTTVLVQQPVLNHKPFNIRLHVKSEVAKTVAVSFFLAPKYDSRGIEIPLHENTKNFYHLDYFIHQLPAGDSVILRECNQNLYMIDKWSPASKVYEKAFNAYNGKGEFILDNTEFFIGFTRRIMLPKGRVGGLPCVLLVYIYDYVAPKDPYGTGTNPSNIFGLGTGSRRMTNTVLGFPLDRPLYEYQIQNLENIYFQDVAVYHKPIPEMYNPFR